VALVLVARQDNPEVPGLRDPAGLRAPAEPMDSPEHLEYRDRAVQWAHLEQVEQSVLQEHQARTA